MISQRLHNNSYDCVLQEIMKITKNFSNIAFITRVKIETTCQNTLIMYHDNGYYESHISIYLKD